MPAIPEILPAHLEQKGQLLGGRKQVEAPGEHTGPYPQAHVSPCCSWPELHQPESGFMPVKLHLLSLPTTGCPDQTPPCPSLLQALPRPLLCRPQRRQILIARTRDLRTTGLKHNSGSACALLHSPPLSWASDDKRLLRILASQTAYLIQAGWGGKMFSKFPHAEDGPGETGGQC